MRLFLLIFLLIILQDKNTLLHWAAANGRVELLGPLLEVGARVNARSGSGATPIYWACAYCHMEVALALAEVGADPSIPDHKVSPTTQRTLPV